MHEPIITCPNCRHEIKLTESLAAPLIEATKRQYEKRLADQEADIDKRQTALREQQAALVKARESIDEQVAAKVKTERAAVAAAEQKKAREALADEIAKTQQDKAATEELLRQRDVKLAEAQRNELVLRRERQQLQEEKEQFELTKQRAIDAERAKIREAAQRDADEQSRLRLAEKDKTISDLQVKLQDALRKAEQGSQQLQGEVLELELESLLRTTFPHDSIDPVPKGESGADILHFVCGPSGLVCGKLLWESKRTKKFSDEWLPKLRGDMRAAKADYAVLVTQALPKEVESFALIDGVWVTSREMVIPLTVVLRQLLIEVAMARQAGEGQQTKVQLIYQYLTGPQFKQRVEAIIEKFAELQADLRKEQKFLMQQWGRREQQIVCVLQSTHGMWGDLQGIAGQTLPQIEGLTDDAEVEGAGPTLPKRLADREQRRVDSAPTDVLF